MPLTSVIALMPGLAAVALVVAALLGGTGCGRDLYASDLEACAKACAPHPVAKMSVHEGCVCAQVRP